MIRAWQKVRKSFRFIRRGFDQYGYLKADSDNFRQQTQLFRDVFIQLHGHSGGCSLWCCPTVFLLERELFVNSSTSYGLSKRNGIFKKTVRIISLKLINQSLFRFKFICKYF